MKTFGCVSPASNTASAPAMSRTPRLSRPRRIHKENAATSNGFPGEVLTRIAPSLSKSNSSAESAGCENVRADSRPSAQPNFMFVLLEVHKNRIRMAIWYLFKWANCNGKIPRRPWSRANTVKNLAGRSLPDRRMQCVKRLSVQTDWPPKAFLNAATRLVATWPRVVVSDMDKISE